MLIFLLFRKIESLAYAYSLANSDRYRIVGCCNRLERVRRGRPTLYPLGFPEPHYILPCTACAVTHRTNLGFANLVRRRAPANGTAGLRNHLSL